MISEKIYQHYLTALLAGDKKICREIVEEELAINPDIENLYTNLFQRSMYEVGALWEHNKISVAIEHLATSITEGLMTLLYPIIFAADKNGSKAIISCSSNEYHQLGAKMVADVFELSGWDGYFLGSNTPTSDIFQLIEDKKPDVVALSLSIYYNMKSLLSLVEALNLNYPGQEILVGGQAFRWGGRDALSKYANTTYLESIVSLKKMIEAN